jgi:hypothetical protein
MITKWFIIAYAICICINVNLDEDEDVVVSVTWKVVHRPLNTTSNIFSIKIENINPS